MLIFVNQQLNINIQNMKKTIDKWLGIPPKNNIYTANSRTYNHFIFKDIVWMYCLDFVSN